MSSDSGGAEHVLASLGEQLAGDGAAVVDAAVRLFGHACFTVSDVRRAGCPLIFVSEAFAQLTGYDAADVQGRDLGSLEGEGEESAATAEARSALDEGRPHTCVVRHRRRDGSIFLDEQQRLPVLGWDGRPSHMLVLHRDVTETMDGGGAELPRSAAESWHEAHHDALTGLPNRRLLEDRVQQALFEARREGGAAALALFDLDHFRFLGKTLGSARAGRVLRELTGRLSAHLRRTDTLARVGEDVFAVLLTKLPRARSALPVIDKLQASVREPVRDGDATLRLSATVGIEVYPDGADDAAALLAHAEGALAEAKAAERGSYRFYAGGFDSAMREHAGLVRDLKRAVLEDQLVLHYQPKVDLQTGTISSVEALVRWAHPERGLLKPADFVPVAEEARLGGELFAWVLEGACRQAMRWQQQRTARRVAINASPQALEDSRFTGRVKEALTRYDLHPGLLEIEINERSSAEVLDAAADKLRDLRGIGVRIALDDFGVAQGSLRQLRGMPLDGLKIDRSFVGRLGGGEPGEDLELVRAIIGLGKSLHLRVTAEGIETREQNTLLRTLACDDGQGFLFSHAVPAEYVPAFA